jgi:hypothetical protein
VTDDLERAVGPDRRTFIRRLVVGTAFAAPVVASFRMSGVTAVLGGDRIMGVGNANTTAPPGPGEYPTQLICGRIVDVTVPFTLDFDDGPVHLHVEVPAQSLPGGGNGTIICIYKGDLGTLDDDVPDGEFPRSAYAVVWNSPPSNDQPDSFNSITLTVTDPSVAAGDTIYVFDKMTGDVTAVDTADDGTWEVTFVVDPAYVVTGVTPPPPGPTPTTPPGSTAPGATPPGAAAPVTAEPNFTG